MKRLLLATCLAGVTLLGGVAQAQVIFTRDTTGYPEQSHTFRRKPMTSYTGGGYELTGLWVRTPNFGTQWTLTDIGGIAGVLVNLPDFPTSADWRIEIFSNRAAFGTSFTGDLASGSVAVVGTPSRFGEADYFGQYTPSWNVNWQSQNGIGIFGPNETLLVSLVQNGGTGVFAWNESDLVTGLGSDVYTTSLEPGAVYDWTSAGYPTGSAGVRVGFAPVPEPGTLSVLGFALAGAALHRRRRQR